MVTLNMSPPQVLFDFVGQEDSSTENFGISESLSGIHIDSSALSGSIEDHNITGFSTLYVIWTPQPEEEVQHFIWFILECLCL